MIFEYDKRNLNLFEYILYNVISTFIFWIMISFIVTIQDYILQKLDTIPGLDLLLSFCPLFIFYWFLQVNSQKLNTNSLDKHPKLLALLIYAITLTILVYFFGFLKISI